jgi:hypothetical protein
MLRGEALRAIDPGDPASSAMPDVGAELGRNFWPEAGDVL